MEVATKADVDFLARWLIGVDPTGRNPCTAWVCLLESVREAGAVIPSNLVIPIDERVAELRALEETGKMFKAAMANAAIARRE